MVTFLLNVLKTLPSNFWYVLGAALGVSSITTPIAIAYLVANSGSINYRTGNTEIILEGKHLSSVNEQNLTLLEQQLNTQNQKIIDLTEAAKEKNIEQKLKPELKELQLAAQESEIRLNDAKASNDELKTYVDERSLLP